MAVSTTRGSTVQLLIVGPEYVISMPNMYARGILWGKMVLELGDSCTAKNERSGYSADIQFKTKVRPLAMSMILLLLDRIRSQGYFSGAYNAIAGRVRRGSTETGEVSGKWSHTMEYKTAKVSNAQYRC